ncbi:MAG TPA: response regulator, partial [Methanospirillum sp.]|nr:response regulator [Methanospirillum sp.]
MISVLYVDDEEVLLQIGKLFLEKMGNLIVDISNSPKQALELISSDKYSAIISDYEMPIMNGIDFLKEVRHEYGDIPFILFTGRGREEVVIQALNNGADFYLQKGGDPKSQFTELEYKVRVAVAKRQAEQALSVSVKELRTAASRYEALIAASNTGAWEYHGDIGYLWCSPEYFSMLGRDIRDFDFSGSSNIKQTWVDLLHPDDRERAITTWETYRDNPEGMYEQYFRMIHKEGYGVWICSRGKMLRDSTGEPTGITVGTHINISDLKRVEEELVRKKEDLQAAYERITASEEKLRSNLEELTRQDQDLRESKQLLADIIEFLPDATLVIDMKGVVIAWNRAMEEMTGVAKNEIIGQGNHAYTVPFYGKRIEILLDLIENDEDEIIS